jgi:hypothetical protein
MRVMRIAIVAAFGWGLVAGAAGCNPPVANRCPGTPAPQCLTDLVCENDPSRGCQVCRCASPGFSPITQPQGAPAPGGP